jgi:hypothetical protein
MRSMIASMRCCNVDQPPCGLVPRSAFRALRAEPVWLMSDARVSAVAVSFVRFVGSDEYG